MGMWLRTPSATGECLLRFVLQRCPFRLSAFHMAAFPSPTFTSRSYMQRPLVFFVYPLFCSVNFAWLYPHCPAGQYQVGDDCVPCPDTSYIDFVGSLKKHNQHPCKACTGCDYTCGYCEKPTGNCPVQPGKCRVDNVCRVPNELKGNGQLNVNDVCRRCLPQVDRYSWSTATAAACDDRQVCSFNDKCTSDAFCVGTPDDCLRKTRTGRDDEDCEECGQDKCQMQTIPLHDADANRAGKAKGCVFWEPVYTNRTFAECATQYRAIVIPGHYESRWMQQSGLQWGRMVYWNAWQSVWVPDYRTIQQYQDCRPVMRPVQTGSTKFCGCSIKGRCFKHGSVNPDNLCE